MEVFENGTNNQQPASNAESAQSGGGFTPGELYAKGEERRIAKDFSGALMWYEKAAEQGSVGAQCQCGDMYFKGEGTAKDGVKALMWYEKAAKQGNARAQMQKAQMQKYKMTQSHYEELKKELDDCKTTRTAEVKKRIYEARLLGDLPENEAYDEAKEAEYCLLHRIKKIEEILQLAVIVEESAVDGDVPAVSIEQIV